MSTILCIAWRNLWRNKRRSVLSLLAVAFACAVLLFMMALQKGSYADMINNAVRLQTGHLQVQHARYLDDRDLLNAVEDPEAVAKILARHDGVRAVSIRVAAPVLAGRGSRSFGAMLYGTDPAAEQAFSSLPSLVREGHWLRPDEPRGAVVGRLLARNLGAGLGDEIVFLGQGRDGSIAADRLIVRGTFSAGNDELDRTLLLAPLETVRAACAMEGRATEVAALLDDDRRRNSLAAAVAGPIAACSPNAVVRGWDEILPGIAQSVRIDWESARIYYAVLALVVALGIANTFLMALLERTREYGVLLALGMRRRSIAAMTYLESLLIILLGIALGLAAGLGLVAYYGVKGIDFSAHGEVFSRYGLNPVQYPRITTDAVVTTVVIVLVLAALMAVYPARKAAALKPVEAMKR